jgi:hypothetical protein
MMDPTLVGKVINVTLLTGDHEAGGDESGRAVGAVVEVPGREVPVSAETSADRTRLIRRKTDYGDVWTLVGGWRLHEAKDAQLTLESRLVQVRFSDGPVI